MLIEFRVSNFRSIRSEQTLSLVASKDDSLPTNFFQFEGFRILRGLVIYGPNASGKTNFLRAIDLLKDLVVDSANKEPGQEIPVQPFLFDSESSTKPSRFEISFFQEGIRYQYGVSLDSARVHEEYLLAYPKNRPQTWFTRQYDAEKEATEWYLGPKLRGNKADLKEKTRDNALFLSVAAQWNHDQLTSVYKWFQSRIQTIPAGVTMNKITERFLLGMGKTPVGDSGSGPTFRRWVVDALRDADMGICDVKVTKTPVEKVRLPKNLPSEVRETILKRLEDDDDLLLNTEIFHEIDGKRSNNALPLQEESSGTQRFFQMIGPWVDACAKDITVVVDELESSLHPLLTRELVKFIVQDNASGTKAQLVFATHDTVLLDPNLFRRDQVWFTVRSTKGETEIYSLSEYKQYSARKGEAIQKGYLAGRYGAIPVLEGFGLK